MQQSTGTVFYREGTLADNRAIVTNHSDDGNGENRPLLPYLKAIHIAINRVVDCILRSHSTGMIACVRTVNETRARKTYENAALIISEVV